MATEPKRKSVKSETLTIRLDPKTRFMLEFVSRLRGQTITTVVERAISAAADQATIEDQDRSQNWKDFWDVSEGVRALNIADESALFPTYEEEKLLHFAEEHAQFFMARNVFGGRSRDAGGPYIDILWPRISEYLDLWDQTKATNYWAVGKKMAEDILAAGVEPPVWPPVRPDKPGSGAPKGKSPLDDDIPF